jgi:hypothetical protein
MAKAPKDPPPEQAPLVPSAAALSGDGAGAPQVPAAAPAPPSAPPAVVDAPPPPGPGSWRWDPVARLYVRLTKET